MKFQASDKTISEVLFSSSDLKIRIPRYQRPYSWSDDQVSEFWNDLIKAKESYFLGGFIFNYEDEKDGFIDVIDGQQRILTITIFLSVLRDICSKYSAKDSHSIQSRQIALEDMYTLEQTFRIIVGDSTRDYFEKYIQTEGNDIYKSNPSTGEERRIKKVHDYFLDMINTDISILSNNEDKVQRINELRRKLSDLTVIKIRIESEEDAYEIFETTNARGVDLSVSDLLKNVIFKHIPQAENKDSAKETWRSITKNIEDSKTELKKFIRYYWLSKYSFVTEKLLFKEIKQNVLKDEWQNLLNELSIDSTNWLKINDGSLSDFSDLKDGFKIHKSIEALRWMQVNQCNVFLLSILRNFDQLQANPVHVIQFIENFTFQYSAISKLPANKVERIYSRYAVMVDKGVRETDNKRVSRRIQQTFESLISELRDLLPSRTVFLEKFAAVSYSKRVLCKYILLKINESMKTSKEYQIDFNNVNIEHVLPQKPVEWGLTLAQVKPYVNLLGNLTLMDKNLNSSAQNKTLVEKLSFLKESELEVTKDFIKNLNDDNNWTNERIINRQEKLAELSYDKIWNVI